MGRGFPKGKKYRQDGGGGGGRQQQRRGGVRSFEGSPSIKSKKQNRLLFKPRPPPPLPAALSALPPFVKRAKFSGAKPGYSFSVGKAGLGYHVDRVQIGNMSEKAKARLAATLVQSVSSPVTPGKRTAASSETTKPDASTKPRDKTHAQGHSKGQLKDKSEVGVASPSAEDKASARSKNGMLGDVGESATTFVTATVPKLGRPLSERRPTGTSTTSKKEAISAEEGESNDAGHDSNSSSNSEEGSEDDNRDDERASGNGFAAGSDKGGNSTGSSESDGDEDEGGDDGEESESSEGDEQGDETRQGANHGENGSAVQATDSIGQKTEGGVGDDDSPEAAPVPVPEEEEKKSFESLGVTGPLCEAAAQLGWTHATDIQRQALPLAFQVRKSCRTETIDIAGVRLARLCGRRGIWSFSKTVVAEVVRT